MLTQVATSMREMTSPQSCQAGPPMHALHATKPQAVDAIDIAASSCASDAVKAQIPLRPLLQASVGPAGTVTTAVLTSRIDFQMRRVPPLLHGLGEVDAAVGRVKAQASDGEVDFSVHYGCDTAWHIARIDSADVWSHMCDGYREPDVFLGISVSPAQEARLLGENITGLMLTPPLPPASDWQLTFFGAQSAQPRVSAQCGYQGPIATLALDNSEVRWSDCATRQNFAFDDALAYQNKKRSVRALRPAPTMPSSTKYRLKPPLAY